MKTAQCPSCGGNLNVPDDKDFMVCPYCGVSVQVREYTKDTYNIPNLLELAYSEFVGENYDMAYDYYNKILEKDANISEAWLGKGKIISMYVLSDAVNVLKDEDVISKFSFGNVNYASVPQMNNLNKYPEMIVCFKECLKHSSGENLEKFEKEIINQIQSLTEQIFSNNLNKFSYISVEKICSKLFDGLIFINDLKPNDEKILEETVKVCEYLCCVHIALKNSYSNFEISEDKVQEEYDKSLTSLSNLNPQKNSELKSKLDIEIGDFINNNAR